MRALLAIVGLFVAAFATPISKTDLDSNLDYFWLQYKQEYKKNYSPEEEPIRHLIWEDNVHYILKHNEEADRGEHTYWLGENEYADMTSSEFSAIMNGYLMNARSTEGDMDMSCSNSSDLPDKVDWRDKGYVTAVKNQKNCGSCWTFSATGALEGQHFKVDKKLVSLSEQNLLDCTNGGNGCNGGSINSAFTYVASNNGIDTEESYPYKAKEGKCRFKKKNVGATDTGFTWVSQSECSLQTAVASVGPISVAIDASHENFQLYKKGIYQHHNCSSENVDHAVLTVGYGTTEGGKDYWLVKNSWGTDWGIKGYFMLARNKNNMCGIATYASYPDV